MHSIKDTTGGVWKHRSLLSCLLSHSNDLLTLLCHTLCTAFPGSLIIASISTNRPRPPMVTDLVLDTTGLHLVGEHFCAVLLSFGFVDVLHKYTLVLENVTL